MTKNKGKKVFIPPETYQKIVEKADKEKKNIDQYIDQLLKNSRDEP